MYDWFHRIFKPAAPKTAVIELAAVPAEVEAAAAPLTQPAPALPAVRGTSWMQRDEINANFSNCVFDANDDAEIFTNQAENEVLDALEKIVRSKQSGANLVRRMPGVIPQLLQSLRTEEFSGTDLSQKISHDVVLVAEVLRLANSVSYHANKAITSIEHAILILGHGGMRQLITGDAFKPIIDLKSGHFTGLAALNLWDQSRQCAIANLLLAQDQAVDLFEAFMAGLMKNVGLIAALRVMDQMEVDARQIGSASFFNALISHARVLSCSIGKEWDFPETVIRAIEEQSSAVNLADMSPIGKILAIQGLSGKERDCLRVLDALDTIDASPVRAKLQ